MRVFDARYRRDLRSYDFALRLIAHEARTQTICDWTGFSEDRVRALYRSYPSIKNGGNITRHRGPRPRRVSLLLDSAHLRGEIAAVAALCMALGVIVPGQVPNAERRLPCVAVGESLCDVFDIYLRINPHSSLTLEHVIALVIAIARGDEVLIERCVCCHGVVVLNRFDVGRQCVCAHCLGMESLIFGR